MKIICSKEDLMDGIATVQKAVSTKTTVPILEGILIEASDILKLTGNNLEIGIEYYIKCDIKSKGTIVLNSKMFGEIIRRLPDSEVLIEVKDNNMVNIECDNSHFQLKGISSEGYPSIPHIEKENEFRISQGLLKDMIRQTIFAVGVDPNRLIFTGSLMECKNEELRLVSIDGFRMSLRKNIVPQSTSNINVIVPGSTLNEVVKILQPVDDELIIYNSNSQVLFDMGKCKVVSRLLNGEYLNYRSVIPEEFETKIKIKTKEILSSIERASLMSSEDRKYPVKFNVTGDKMIITSNADMGAVREEIYVDTQGKDLEIGFNPRYFIEALKVIEDETIEIFFNSGVGPCTMKSMEEDKFAYMILPVRI